jgi:hypothetical protein
MLLGHRWNAPASHWWFTPGGRVRKNEPLASCLERVEVSELGLQASEVHGARLMGVWDHFMRTVHSVTMCRRTTLTCLMCFDCRKRLINALPSDQHSGGAGKMCRQLLPPMMCTLIFGYMRSVNRPGAVQWVVRESLLPSSN